MFWDSLDIAARSELEIAGAKRRFPDRSTIFVEGAESSYVVLVLSGEIKLTATTYAGQEVLIELRGRHELIGELGVLESRPRSTSAIALGNVEVITVPAARFRGLLKSNSAISYAVLRSVARRLRQSLERQTEVGTSVAKSRLAARFIERAEKGTRLANGSYEVHPALSQQDWASWIGVSRDAVVGALKELRKAELVETSRMCTVIKDIEGLRKIASNELTD